GTRVSAGLGLARQIVAAHPGRTNDVVLLSDLNDSLFDVSALSTALAELRRDRIHLRIVGMNASPGDRAFFQQRLGRSAVIEPRELFSPARGGSGGTPRELVLLVV